MKRIVQIFFHVVCVLIVFDVHALPPGSGELFYVHNDALGTPQALTNESGNVVWTAETDPFGGAKVNEDPDGDGNKTEFNVRFPGQYYDKETGLHYNDSRYYDPGNGRYITSDSVGLKGGLNTFSYVDGNPLSRTDPDGKRWVQCDTISNGECWVPDPPVDNSPAGKCITGDCAAGLEPTPLDLRTLPQIECDSCIFTCNMSTLLLPSPIPSTLRKAAIFGGVSGAAVLSCDAVCREECLQCSK